MLYLSLVQRGPDPVQGLREDVQQREAHAGDGPCVYFIRCVGRCICVLFVCLFVWLLVLFLTIKNDGYICTRNRCIYERVRTRLEEGVVEEGDQEPCNS